jgi:pimeloyl-ACP methyl ester carboxylesterase
MANEAESAWRKQRVPAASFTVAESAHDVEDLRKALGLPKIALYGFSYGSHLALAVLRRFPGAIDRCVLIGVEGPDDTFKLPMSMDSYFGNIAALASASKNVSVPGGLSALHKRVHAALSAKPVEIAVRHRQSSARMFVGGFGLNLLIRADLGDAFDLRMFPRLLTAIEGGDLRPLSWFVQRRVAAAVSLNGMSMATDASAGATPERLSRIAAEMKTSAFWDVADIPFPALSDLWPSPAKPEASLGALQSTAPCLLLSGELDWNAPCSQAEALLPGLPNAHHVVVRNAGHEQIFFNPEARAAVTAFLNGSSPGAMSPTQAPLQFVPTDPNVSGPTHPAIE